MKTKKIMAMILIVVMGILTACGSSEALPEEKETSSAAMGRYVESSIEMPAISWPTPIFELEDGSANIFDRDSFRLVSSDASHDTWAEKQAAFLDEAGKVSYAQAIAISRNGDCILSYIEKTEETESTEDYDFNPLYEFIKNDGTVTPLNIELENEGFFAELAFTQDGRAVGYTYGGDVYEINVENGEITLLFKTDDVNINSFDITSQYIIAIAGNSLYFFDLEKNQLKDTPSTLTQFVKEQNIDPDMGSSECKNYHFYEGKDSNTLYILNTNGLYRYVMDGNSIEQLIDGSLCSIGNPSYNIQSFVEESSGTFLVLFTQGILKRYTFDATVSSVPDNCLKIYSLQENQTIKQAISQFQINDPDTYVKYEIGMNENADITYEDAIQNLNKELLSDDSPDIILLDGLPMDNYAKEGVLTDLSGYLEKLNPDNAIFTNITESMKMDTGIFVMPVKCQIPVMITDKNVLPQIQDIKSLADVTEKMQQEDTSKTVMELYTPEEVLELLIMMEGSNFNKDGQFDKEECSNLLTQAKRIYDVMLKTIPPQRIQSHTENMTVAETSGMMIDNKWFYQASGQGVNVLAEMNRIAVGLSYGFSFDMNTIATIPRQEDTLAYNLGFHKGDTRFVPSCMLGVTANSKQTDAAIDFIATALSPDVQNIEMLDGLPVNQKSINKLIEPGLDEKAVSGGLGLSQEGSDEPFMLDVLYPNKQQGEELNTYLQSLDTPVIIDDVMKNTIIEIAPRAVSGEISIDEAVNAIDDKMRIRLAE